MAIDFKERKTYIGGSDIAHVVGAGEFSCARRLAYDKLDYEPDFDSTDKMEFRRGHRQEPVAVAYYREKNPEHVIKLAQTIRLKDKPHLGVNMDRLVQIPGRLGWGYLEVKTAGKFSFQLIKKEGLYPAYITQLHYGMELAGLSYGVFVIFCPDEDELLAWVVDADKDLGATLIDEGDDFWRLWIKNKKLPPPLPEIKNVCLGCDYRVKCRGKADLSEFKEKKPRKTKEKKDE
jgi:predicted phage-related endonuclease